MIKFPTKAGICTLMSQSEHMLVAKIDHAAAQSQELSINSKHPDQLIRIGPDLTPQGRQSLAKLLHKSQDVFAWTPGDMTGVPRYISKHSLNLNVQAQPVVQKKRGMAAYRGKAVCSEVDKLVKAGILKEVHYHTWVANPVMVKKSDGSWRMCVDFKDLNKACPKDCYPLPEIDLKVDSLAGYNFKCFLDAYKGYHYVQMRKEDEEKTSFHTPKGIFCYTKMPFGLKNAGATYQRLIDRAFGNQIGRNMEAYVDDLVIKSSSEEAMLLDIQETFDNLRKINMKLNPGKCSLGFLEGKFLGHIVSKQEIKANPDKIREIQQMISPRSRRDVQSLNGFAHSIHEVHKTIGAPFYPKGITVTWNAHPSFGIFVSGISSSCIHN
ncbi:hypothetical protein E3N88_15147 [Mikania micrantha]|uniref:Reverse transcriptase domain-containing protein n=1 Tax=Mikania micrantha TaxID=192012 RepID=A0A5N6NW05_9ASTR|nr:hypothetical protein E3N88_15147 [Mikania micrantha]